MSSGPQLTRAELAAAGRRKLEEFRRQKAAGKAAAEGAPSIQTASTNGAGVIAAQPAPQSIAPVGAPSSLGDSQQVTPSPATDVASQPAPALPVAKSPAATVQPGHSMPDASASKPVSGQLGWAFSAASTTPATGRPPMQPQPLAHSATAAPKPTVAPAAIPHKAPPQPSLPPLPSPPAASVPVSNGALASVKPAAVGQPPPPPATAIHSHTGSSNSLASGYSQLSDSYLAPASAPAPAWLVPATAAQSPKPASLPQQEAAAAVEPAPRPTSSISTTVEGGSEQPAAGAATSSGEDAIGMELPPWPPRAMLKPKPVDFKELMRHIDELTEEKFTLQRCLEQQTGLADRLAEDNEALTKAINSQAGAAEAARAEVQEARQAAEEAKAQASAAAAERDSYALAAREAADRAKGLACEVVQLEEKVLQARSAQLRERVDASGASKAVSRLQGEVEQLTRERAAMAQDLQALREELAGQKWATERRIDGGGEAATAAAARPSMDGASADWRQQEDADAIADAGYAGLGAPNAVPMASLPPSAYISQSALQQTGGAAQENGRKEEAEGAQAAEQRHGEASAVPAELRYLLPESVWAVAGEPGAEAEAALPVVERIYAMLDAIEAEKKTLLAGLAERQAEAAALKAANSELHSRVAALQRLGEQGSPHAGAGSAL